MSLQLNYNQKSIQMRCQDVLQSPYSFRELPPDLRRLQAVMRSASALAGVDVPNLLSEIKSLRAEIAQLKKQIG
jgi:hypothetical protein